MRTFKCTCGSTVFFENARCVSCGNDLGWCPVCHCITALLPADDGHVLCGNDSCQAKLTRCHNYAVENVCNRCCVASDDPSVPAVCCDYCRLNDTIPDLTVSGNRDMWSRLEAAKRRLLYTLDLLQLPYGRSEDGVDPPLSFDFKADVAQRRKWWWAMGKEEQVYTGHANGKITINVREADSVEREKARVMFQEAHRTIIGHFRHEIAHYYWEMLVPGYFEADFKATFGDHETPAYADAQQKYYQDGPLADWQPRFISAYATMHPWEDFAETFATYLDMVSVLDTAMHMGVSDGCDITQANLPAMVEQYALLGVVLNEMNRAMGLIDLVPEVFAASIVTKLQFVHDLVRAAGSTQSQPVAG